MVKKKGGKQWLESHRVRTVFEKKVSSPHIATSPQDNMVWYGMVPKNRFRERRKLNDTLHTIIPSPPGYLTSSLIAITL